MCRVFGLTAVLILLLAGACNRPFRDRPQSGADLAGSHEEQIMSGGMSRSYILHVPIGTKGSSPVPLLLNFHGAGSNARQQEALSGTSGKADREEFIVAYPEGINAEWHTGPETQGIQDRQFVRDLIAHLESQYNIDRRRIYATGISNGGGMVDRIGCNMADLIAAIAPDSGAYNFWKDCNPSRPMPVLAFHGLDDNVVPYDGGIPTSMEPPIEQWAAGWASRDGCASIPVVTVPGQGVTVRSWPGCQGGAQVILYTLANHGHSWPGSAVMPPSITSQAVNATDLMWDFFQRHPMP
ncbi:MAG TPA: PHB depolymerase family esterase [Anaerolineales bacterium]